MGGELFPEENRGQNGQGGGMQNHGPLHEERKGINKGFFKQIIFYKNLELIDKYFVENPERWGKLKELFDFDYSAHSEFSGKEERIKKGFWFVIFRMLEKEKEEGYEKLKEAWSGLGEIRERIIFACGTGGTKHPDFLVWVIKKRIDDVVYNDSMPRLLIKAMQSIVRIVVWDSALSENRKGMVLERLDAERHEGEYRRIMANEIAIGYVWGGAIKLLKESGLSDDEIKKLLERLNRIDKERKLAGFVKKETERWLKETQVFSTASQHTQND